MSDQARSPEGTGEKQEVQAEVFKSDSGQKVVIPGVQPVSKKSEQQTRQELTVNSWVEPRISFGQMLDFYDMNVWHKRAVLLKSAVIAGLGWSLVTEDENKKPDADYRRIMQLLEHPNDKAEENFTEICTRMLIDLESTGNGFTEVARNLKGEIVELYHARAATVRRDKGLKNGGYWQGINIDQSRVHFATFGSPNRRPGENEMLQYLQYDPRSDYYGAPDWLPALADMLLDRNIAEYYITLFGNQLMAKFAIIVEGGKLSETALENVKKFVSKNYAGIENAGKTIYLNSEQTDVKIKIEKLNIDFGKEGDGKSSLREQARDATIAAHGVPPRMVGIMSAGQLGGGGEVSGQLKSWKENDINPRQSRFEAFLNNTILASFGDHKWKLKFSEMDISDITVDGKYWQMALNPATGWADRAEAREAQGFAPEQADENKRRRVEKMMEQLPQFYRKITAFRELLESAEPHQMEL